jgi:carboxypeptidase family protein
MLIDALACLMLLQPALGTAPHPQTNPSSASIQGIIRRVGTGEPVPKARVTLNALPNNLQPIPNQSLAPPRTVTTGKDGRFVFAGLAAGRYSLSAFANGYVRQSYGQKGPNQPGTTISLNVDQELKDITFDMVPTGTITGRIYDLDNTPLPGADVVLQRFAYDGNGQKTMQVVQQARTNDLGEYRLYWVTPGKYFIRADYTGGPSPMSRNPNEYMGPLTEGYASTFYPGSADPSAAAEIDIAAGTELGTIDITFVRSRTFKITGRVIVTASLPSGSRPFVGIRPKQGGGSGNIPTTMNPDGSFEIRNVIPGAYILNATAGNPVSGLRAERSIDVNNDVEGVVLTLSAGFTLPIHIVFEGQQSATATAVDPVGNMRAMLRSSDGNFVGGSIMSMMDPPVLKPNGLITLSQVQPGTYRLNLNPLPSPDHYIKAITLGLTDALRDGLTLDRTPDMPVEVLVSANGGRIEGSVRDKDGKPSVSTQVILVPNERTQADRFRVSATDTNGHFTMRGISPGEYKLFAWDGLEAGAYRDPDVVRRYEELGVRAAILEGSNPNVELRVIRVP